MADRDAASVDRLTTYRCEACGADLTPTPEQIRALQRFGNPLRRPPCLETEDGFHVVSDNQLEAVSWERRSRVR